MSEKVQYTGDGVTASKTGWPITCGVKRNETPHMEAWLRRIGALK